MKDGGPAFPRSTQGIVRGDGSYDQIDDGAFGMTLRDYFAAAVISAAIRDSGWRISTDRSIWADAAGKAYEIADAMLKARKDTNEAAQRT